MYGPVLSGWHVGKLMYLQLFIYHSGESTSICFQTCSHTPPQPCPAVAYITVISVSCCLVNDLERTRCSQRLTPVSPRDGPSLTLFRHLTVSQVPATWGGQKHSGPSPQQSVTHVMVCLTLLKIFIDDWNGFGGLVHLALSLVLPDCNHTTQRNISHPAVKLSTPDYYANSGQRCIFAVSLQILIQCIFPVW